jgi:hypothetical protein
VRTLVLILLLVAQGASAHMEYHFDLGDLRQTREALDEPDWEGPIHVLYCDVSVTNMRSPGGIEFWILINGVRNRQSAEFNQSIRVTKNGRYKVEWIQGDDTKLRVPARGYVSVIPQKIGGLEADLAGKCRADKGHF